MALTLNLVSPLITIDLIESSWIVKSVNLELKCTSPPKSKIDCVMF